MRAPFATGCFVVASSSAYLALSVPPPTISCDFGVPGLATSIPICEYVKPPVASNVWIRMYSAKQRAVAPLVTAVLATLQVGI